MKVQRFLLFSQKINWFWHQNLSHRDLRNRKIYINFCWNIFSKRFKCLIPCSPNDKYSNVIFINKPFGISIISSKVINLENLWWLVVTDCITFSWNKIFILFLILRDFYICSDKYIFVKNIKNYPKKIKIQFIRNYIFFLNDNFDYFLFQDILIFKY